MSALLEFLNGFKPMETTLKELFAKDPKRFEKYSQVLEFPEGKLLVDYSKNLIDDELFEKLIQLASAIRFYNF
ncbi:hypothetical protein SprV_0501803900 [Sparganum proliferum]